MNTHRHAYALICVLTLSTAFAASASAGESTRISATPSAGAKSSASSPSSNPTYKEARGEFRKALRSSPALRWEHAKSVVRKSGMIALYVPGSMLLAAPVGGVASALLASNSAFLIAGGAVAAGISAIATGGVLREATRDARETTAQSMIKRGIISPRTFKSWEKAGLFSVPDPNWM